MNSKTRPTQAVILAGGQGTRLAPITNTIPKPMVEFHGKPFLEYLVEMLRDQGFGRILLLLGYLPDKIQDYFGDGGDWGVSIQYSVTPVENETGRRIKLARKLLDPTFLLMYCDNYWPMDFDAMWRRFTDSRVSAQVTVYDNLDAYTRDNLHINPEGLVEAYDPSRQMPGLQGVDIGFLILNDTVVDFMSDENASFEHMDKASGNNLARPEFERLQREIFNGEIHTVVVWKLDRLSRSLRDGINTLADWCDKGLRVVSVTQQIDFNGSLGKMLAAVLLGVAEMEQETRRERQAAGIAAAKERGVYFGRKKGTTKAKPKRAAELKRKGLTDSEIGNALGVSRRSVQRYLRAAETG